MGNNVHKGVSETNPKKELREDMENQKTSFTFEIDNFSEKESLIWSPIFLSSGCEWFVKVFPKGYHVEDHLAAYLQVSNPESLRRGWKRRANFSFIVLNQSGKELTRTSEGSGVFCAEVPSWGYSKMLPFSKLQEEGFVEKNKLIIKVEVEVTEVVHEGEVTGKEMLDFQGFQVLYSQAISVSWIFAIHPNIAVDFKPKDNGVKTAYMNLLLSLIETLRKPSQSFSEAELTNVRSKLSELTEAGFRVDWLKTKLEKVSLERKNAIADGSPVQELEERVKNLELTLSDLKVELESEKAKSAAAPAKVLSFQDVLLC